MRKTYQGGCHCGRVRFEVETDLSAGTGRCNCSFCAKTRWWGAIVKPQEFRLIGEDVAADYQFGSMVGHHRFCPTCGVQVYGAWNLPELGGEMMSVSVAVLEGIDPEELAALPVRYADGLRDNWYEPPKVTSYL